MSVAFDIPILLTFHNVWSHIHSMHICMSVVLYINNSSAQSVTFRSQFYLCWILVLVCTQKHCMTHAVQLTTLLS